MWYNAKEDTNYIFKLQRGVLTESPAVEQTVGGFLLDGLANVELMKSILRRVGLTAAVNYFDAHVASRENVQIGWVDYASRRQRLSLSFSCDGHRPCKMSLIAEGDAH